MKNIIRKILKEDRRQMYLDKIIHVIKNDYPLFKNMELYGFYDQLSEEELIYIFSGIFGKPVKIKVVGRYESNGLGIYDENGNQIYSERYDGDWIKREYDENNKLLIYEEYSDGYWTKREYDENGNEIYYENSDGYWEKREYDENDNEIYYEDSDGDTIDDR